MGKGKRTKAASDVARSVALEKQLIEKKKKAKTRLTALIVVAAILVVGFGITFGSVEYNKLTKDGFFARRSAVYETDNFSFNTCMMQYFFNSNIKKFTDSNADYLSSIGLDTSASLKDQTSYYDADKTWYEYFMEQTENQVKEILAMCEAAKKKGYEIEKSDNKTIKTAIDTLKDTAEKNNQTVREYLDETYGTLVKLEDIRECMKLTTLASKYYTDYSASLKYTDKEIDSYFTANKANYLECHYLYYVVTNNASGKESAAELKVLNDKAQKTAKKIAAAKNETEFKKLLESYIKKQAKAGNPKITSDELKEEVEAAMSSAQIDGAPYDVSTPAGEWMFDPARKVGDTKVLKSDDDNGYCVYCMTEVAGKDTSPTRTVRHILLSKEDFDDTAAMKKQANKILKIWRNGEKTEKSFGELAKEYSSDTGSVSNGGLYENFGKSEMVESFTNWSFDKSRKAGDTDIIESDYGMHIMYFVSEGLDTWKVNVVADLKNADYQKALKKLQKKYPAEKDDGNLSDVSQVLTASEADTTAQQQPVAY